MISELFQIKFNHYKIEIRDPPGQKYLYRIKGIKVPNQNCSYKIKPPDVLILDTPK